MQNLLYRLKQLEIVQHGKVKLSHAGNSDTYFDFKKAFGDAEAFHLLTKYLGEHIPNGTTCIAGGGYGGIPLATSLSLMFYRNLTLVREKPKKYGTMKTIEGHVPTKEDKVTIVDDVFTTGKTLQKIVDLLAPTGAEIVGCYVLLKRGQGDLTVPTYSLLKPEDLV